MEVVEKPYMIFYLDNNNKFIISYNKLEKTFKSSCKHKAVSDLIKYADVSQLELENIPYEDFLILDAFLRGYKGE